MISSVNKGMFTDGLTRPDWICSNAKQVAILGRDISGSVAGQKAQDICAATSGLINELAHPVNKDGFEVIVLDFNTTAKLIHDLTPATQLVGKSLPVNPGGNTNITSALESALPLIGKVKNSEVRHLRSVFILFSDGQHNTGESPERVAEEVKKEADLVTVAFGVDADEILLKKLATSPQHFYRCRDGKELRAFFAAVGETMTMTKSRGINATQALTQINFEQS